MTIDKLIARLEWFKSQVGGDAAVVVTDGYEELGFCLTADTVDDAASETGAGARLLIDLTGTPEE